MRKPPFSKVLIANRGEIAVRIIRACNEMGIHTVAIFSDADKTALHVQLADEADLIGPAAATESYLNIDKVIQTARKFDVDAIHPGYGFLSERAAFAEACDEAGIAFIGPSGSVMNAMGDKLSARAIAEKAGVPTVPGSKDAISDMDVLRKSAESAGYPVMLKASAGGGGKGMRLVREENELVSSFERASSEAAAAFGDPAVYLEKYIENPRHIEIQILADAHGNVVHLGERECSVQRRHQKIIEETPSAALDEKLRAEIANAAVSLAKACNYRNAGTVEFILGQDNSFYFLEMNTRLQVEHPVTELVTGVDIVKEQLLIEAGEQLRFTQEEIEFKGSAIEVRVYAEDADNNFAPSPGQISHLIWPGGPGIRIDGGVYSGYSVPLEYDPMLAKICTWAENRQAAITRMIRALNETRVGGIVTSVPFIRRVLRHPDFMAGNYDTHFLDDRLEEMLSSDTYDDTVIAALGVGIIKNSNEGYVKARDRSCSNWKMQGRREFLGR